jgi:cyclopropane-fatty-acyl-phospholipid synthase
MLRAVGTSPAAIAHHYDLPGEFFAQWLGEDLVYSCGLWNDDEDPARDLAVAQQRKLDFFAQELLVPGARVLDIGCGWGALLDRFVTRHGAAQGVGLTLSASQARHASQRRVPGVDYQVQSWVDHRPDAAFDAITCIEATEHLASDRLSAEDKVAVYRQFFAHCAAWLKDEGRLGLQLICLDNVGHDGSRAGRGRSSELIRVDIFPESMPASLSEMVLGWETDFELLRFDEHHAHYGRTFRAWGLAFRAHRDAALALVGNDTVRTFARYFATGELYFRRREHALYRVILRKRPRPKRWVQVPGPMPTRAPPSAAGGANAAAALDEGASAAAVQAHYDVSNDFYRLWLGPSMAYSSGLWSSPADPPSDLAAAQRRKLDFFARHVLPGPGAAVLDVGCGWGHNLRRLVDEHHVARAVGLTLSQAQGEHLSRQPVPGAEIRLEHWQDHRPRQPYDAILSYGAFEHFARDGSTSAQRVQAYRRFFAACFDWLADDGRLGLETIAHDNAPDTAAPRGRGPLGDAVQALYPESICPHLCELVLGFEPWFEVELLRCDADDFARTFRAWLLGLREHAAAARALVGEEMLRNFQRYLVSSEMQFRTGALTNVRVVLHRRPELRW